MAAKKSRTTVNSRGCIHYGPPILADNGESEVRLHDKARPEAVLSMRVPLWIADGAVQCADEDGFTLSTTLTVAGARDLRNRLDRFVAAHAEGMVIPLRTVGD